MKVFLAYQDDETISGGTITDHVFGGRELVELSKAITSCATYSMSHSSHAFFVGSDEVKAVLENCKDNTIVIQTTDNKYPRIRIPLVNITISDFTISDHRVLDVVFHHSDTSPAVRCLGSLDDMHADIEEQEERDWACKQLRSS